VTRVVVSPDLIVGVYFDEQCKRVLLQWRDGLVRLVLNRELLVIYLRTLREIGIAEREIRRWSTWFSSSNKVEFSPQMNLMRKGGAELSRSVAEEMGTVMICWRLPAAKEGNVITAEEWIKKSKKEAL
jgi:hypothetical protein